VLDGVIILKRLANNIDNNVSCRNRGKAEAPINMVSTKVWRFTDLGENIVPPPPVSTLVYLLNVLNEGTANILMLVGGIVNISLPNAGESTANLMNAGASVIRLLSGGGATVVEPLRDATSVSLLNGGENTVNLGANGKVTASILDAGVGTAALLNGGGNTVYLLSGGLATTNLVEGD
jgi:hypothetical protein